MSKCKTCLDRRKFLELGVQSASVLALSSPMVSLLSACGSATTTSTSIGTITAITGVATMNFSDYPQLAAAGGSIHVTIKANSGSIDMFVTRVNGTTATAVSVKCTHQSCTLGSYTSSTQKFLCPCHGSVFSYAGAVISGPATSPLTSYSTTLTSSSVQITVT
jgi:Rieske Fe-S protein